VKRETGAEAVFVYTTKSQRLRVCRAIVARSCDTSRRCDIGFILLRTVITVSAVADGPARRDALLHTWSNVTSQRYHVYTSVICAA